MDPFGQICFAIWSTYHLLGIDKQWFYIPAITLAVFRGMMTFFKMFEPTRYLSTISVKVFFDLIPFLLVLLGQNFVFAVVFKALDFAGEDEVNDMEGEHNY